MNVLGRPIKSNGPVAFEFGENRRRKAIERRSRNHSTGPQPGQWQKRRERKGWMGHT